MGRQIFIQTNQRIKCIRSLCALNTINKLIEWQNKIARRKHRKLIHVAYVFTCKKKRGAHTYLIPIFGYFFPSRCNWQQLSRSLFGVTIHGDIILSGNVSGRARCSQRGDHSHLLLFYYFCCFIMCGICNHGVLGARLNPYMCNVITFNYNGLNYLSWGAKNWDR